MQVLKTVYDTAVELALTSIDNVDDPEQVELLAYRKAKVFSEILVGDVIEAIRYVEASETIEKYVEDISDEDGKTFLIVSDEEPKQDDPEEEDEKSEEDGEDENGEEEEKETKDGDEIEVKGPGKPKTPEKIEVADADTVIGRDVAAKLDGVVGKKCKITIGTSGNYSLENVFSRLLKDKAVAIEII